MVAELIGWALSLAHPPPPASPFDPVGPCDWTLIYTLCSFWTADQCKRTRLNYRVKWSESKKKKIVKKKKKKCDSLLGR